MSSRTPSMLSRRAWLKSTGALGVVAATSNVLGCDDDSIVLPPVNKAHCFMVEVPAGFTDASDETILKIHDIIRMEKPAHATYYLRFAAALLGHQTVEDTVALGVVEGVEDVLAEIDAIKRRHGEEETAALDETGRLTEEECDQQ